MDLADCTTLLIDLTLGEHLQILGERRRGYVHKWHLQYKTSDILQRSSLEPNFTTECLSKLVHGLKSSMQQPKKSEIIYSVGNFDFKFDAKQAMGWKKNF